MDKNLEKVLSSLLDKNTYKISFDNDNHKVNINSSDLFKVEKNIKNNDKLKFSQLLELTAVDYPDRAKRFSLVYIFLG